MGNSGGGGEYIRKIWSGGMEYGGNGRMCISACRAYFEKSILVFDPFSDFLRILKYRGFEKYRRREIRFRKLPAILVVNNFQVSDFLFFLLGSYMRRGTTLVTFHFPTPSQYQSLVW